ncbi:MAG: protein kinase [Labilithrix sp.]|nr:protein kinase [Labilithrix sp.]
MPAADRRGAGHVEVKRCAECGARFGVDARFCPFDGAALARATWTKAGDPRVRAIVDGRYEILEPLGEGGMGTVYAVRHVTLDRRFAMKVLRRDLSTDAELTARFLREARATAAIDHPSVVAINDFGELADGSPYFVMELLEGETLAARLRARGPLPPASAARLAARIADALAAAHAVNVIHRDLKPENVFLVGAGRSEPEEDIRVVDFGAATILGGSKLTRPGIVFGTPSYMSPEQASGEPIDGRADVYSLGVVLFEMLTGRAPFQAETYMGVLTKHIHEAPPRPVPPAGARLGALEDVVTRALQKEPAMRYASMTAFAQALEAAALEDAGAIPGAGERARAPTMRVNRPAARIEGAPGPGLAASTRRRIVAGVVAACAALGLVAVVVSATAPPAREVTPARATHAPSSVAPPPPSAAPSRRGRRAGASPEAGPSTGRGLPVDDAPGRLGRASPHGARLTTATPAEPAGGALRPRRAPRRPATARAGNPPPASKGARGAGRLRGPLETFDVRRSIVTRVLAETLTEADRRPNRLYRARVAKKKILLVDADPRSLRVVEVSLRKAGYNVACVEDGLAALDVVDAQAPDLVICDTKLPKLDGYALVRRLKDRSEHASGHLPRFLALGRGQDPRARARRRGLPREAHLRPRAARPRERRPRAQGAGRDRHAEAVDAPHALRRIDPRHDRGRSPPDLRISPEARSITFKSGARLGYVWFKDGKVIDAEVGALRGEEAVYRLLVWSEADFEVDFGPLDRDDVVDVTTSALVMEGMRRADEWGRLVEQLPPLTTVFEVDHERLLDRTLDPRRAERHPPAARRAPVPRRVVDDSPFGLSALGCCSSTSKPALPVGTQPPRPRRPRVGGDGRWAPAVVSFPRRTRRRSQRSHEHPAGDAARGPPDRADAAARSVELPGGSASLAPEEPSASAPVCHRRSPSAADPSGDAAAVVPPHRRPARERDRRRNFHVRHAAAGRARARGNQDAQAAGGRADLDRRGGERGLARPPTPRPDPTDASAATTDADGASMDVESSEIILATPTPMDPKAAVAEAKPTTPRRSRRPWRRRPR